MRVRELMTDQPAYALVNDTAQKAARLMIENDCGIIPVVSEEESRRLVGVITDRDLSNCIVASGKDSRRVRLQECMTNQVISCEAEDDIERVLGLMKENQIRRVPVCEEGGRLLGIVSQADILREMDDIDRAKVEETLEEISEPTGVPSRTRERFTVPEESELSVVEEGLGQSEEEEEPAGEAERRPAVKMARKSTGRRTRAHKARPRRRSRGRK